MRRFMKKGWKAAVLFVASLFLLFESRLVTNAAGESGILGNGTSGIYIDIKGYPYTHYAQTPTWGKYAYTQSGCTWFATARATQKTGKQFPTIYSGYSWYNSQYSRYGFSRGSQLRAGALACYENHVAVVEAIEGNQVVISEGGYTGTDAAHGYTVIRKRNSWDMGSAGPGGRLLGYVYLTNGAVNPPVQASLNWTGERCEYDTVNAFFYAKANTNIRGAYTQAGFTLWDEQGNVVASKVEDPKHTGTFLEIWYNVKNETGVDLKPGTNYKYQIYTIFNGVRYNTETKHFRTRGQAENSWIQPLTINDWNEGTPANVPTAVAKYGTPVFTYGTDPNGTFTSDIPSLEGTYYVKATVAPTDQYVGLTAIKQFRVLPSLKPKVEDVFVDVNADDWYRDNLQYVYENEIMTGLDATHFCPTGLLARAQLAMILYRMEGSPSVTYTKQFEDVPAGQWFTDAVVWAYQNKIITGYTDSGLFKPSNHISRQEMATMMYRYAKYKGYNTSIQTDLTRFPDSGTVSSFAEIPMKWCVGTAIITGDGVTGQLMPHGTTNRAVCATIIRRFMDTY